MFQGSPEAQIHQYLFKKFNVKSPKEMRTSTLLLADVLREPLQDYEE